MFFMKKINLFILSVAVLAGGLFSSCTKEADPEGPQIAFSNSLTETTLAKGVAQWEVNATITSVAGLSEVKVFQVSAGGEDQLGDAITSFTDKNTYNLKLTVNNIKELTTVKVSATDKNNITNSKNFVIKVTAADPIPAGDELVFYTGTISAQLGAQGNALGSAYASSTNSIYLKGAAKTNSSKVDFIYYYSPTASTSAEMISPKFAQDNGDVLAASTWGVINQTKLKDVSSSVSSTQFDAIITTDDAPVTTAASSMTDQQVKALVVGDVFAFETAAGKKGLAKVKALAAGTGSDYTKGTITIEVKVQK